jgi:hypothetical protein
MGLLIEWKGGMVTDASAYLIAVCMYAGAYVFICDCIPLFLGFYVLGVWLFYSLLNLWVCEHQLEWVNLWLGFCSMCIYIYIYIQVLA